jgi:hypothetical protein
MDTQTDSAVIYLTDMSQCLPESALSTRRRKHQQLLEYEAEHLKGVMVSAGPETEALQITVPLNVEGWHEIHLGLLWREASEYWLKVKRTDDPCFIDVTTTKPEGAFVEGDFLKYQGRPAPHLEEGFWKCADLTGQDLIVAQQTEGMPASAALAYIKLVPVEVEQVEALLKDRERRDTKRLIAMNDGFSFIHRKRTTTVEGICEEIEPYRHTDFGKLFWTPGCSIGPSSYPSKLIETIGSRTEDFPRIGDRYIAESMQILRDKGIDSLRTVIDFAHEIGLELHVSCRMGANASSPPWEEFFTSRYFEEHPEFHCVDKDGEEVSRLSYAFPEVQEYIKAFFREWIEYGTDGINLIFVRGLPLLLYERPLVDGFREQFGQDPRDLDDEDPRWLQYRGEVMTHFLRDVRREVDEIAAELGRKRLELSAVVMPNGPANTFYGLDVATWAREGLLDVLIPIGDYFSWFRDESFDIGFFVRAVQGTNCKLYPNIFPRQMQPEAYRERAKQYYEMGAEGLCLWDTNDRHTRLQQWEAVRRLGHREEVSASHREDKPNRFLLKTLGGYRMDKYPTSLSF